MPSKRYKEVIDELKADVPNRSLTAQERLARVAELKAEIKAVVTEQQEAGEVVTAKPDYASIFELLANEEDQEVKQKLQEEAYKFTAPLTEEEKSIFSYIPIGYMEDNPGYNDEGEWVSYVGSFPNPDTGEYS